MENVMRFSEVSYLNYLVAHGVTGLIGMQLGDSELRRAVDGDEEVEPPLLGVNLGDVHVEVADSVLGELLLGRLVAADLGQAADAMALQTAVEAGAGQVRDTRLKGVEAVVEREQRPLTEGYNDGFLLRSEHGRARLTRPHRGVRDGSPLAPFS